MLASGSLLRWILAVASVPLILLVVGCAAQPVAPPPVVPVVPVSPASVDSPWNAIEGWADDAHEEAWPALLENCRAMTERGPSWRDLCASARAIPSPTREEARTFFETWFAPPTIATAELASVGLMTGYFEPVLAGNPTQTDRYRYPVYARPPDLIVRSSGKPRRVRRVKKRLVPYYTRAEIDGQRKPLAGNELVWLADPLDRYVLHVEGSGRVRFPDGREIALDYDEQNGHPWRPLGRHLVDRGILPLEEVTLPRIREWAAKSEARLESAIATDPSYVFFATGRDVREGPRGALGVPLTPARSIAVDRRHVPLGSAIWLVSNWPERPGRPLMRLVFAQDTGGAIKGEQRVDFFWGGGRDAEQMAGTTKERVRLHPLVVRTDSRPGEKPAGVESARAGD
jgi:membrane-bound lytic murein transglycosylase A